MEMLKARKQGNAITITIPKNFNIPVGTKLKPRLTHNGIFYEFIEDDFLDFDTNILNELVDNGYEGKELVEKFREYKQAIPQAMDQLISEAEQAEVMTKEEAKKAIGL